MPIRTPPVSPNVSLRETLNWIAHDDFRGRDTSWEELQVATQTADPEILDFTYIAIKDREEKAKPDLLSGLRNGDVVACGQEVAAGNVVAPQFIAIPAAFWNDADVQWDDNAARGPSKSYVGIQIDRAKALEVWAQGIGQGVSNSTVASESNRQAATETMANHAAHARQGAASSDFTAIGPPVVTLRETANWIARRSFDDPVLPRKKWDARLEETTQPPVAQDEHAALLGRAKSQLTTALRRGVIQARGWSRLGFASQIIPTEFWIWANINWERSEAAYNAEDYLEVVLGRDDVLALWPRDIHERKAADSVGKRKRGANPIHDYAEIDQELIRLLDNKGARAFKRIGHVVQNLKQQLGNAIGQIPDSTLRSHIKEWKKNHVP